MEWLVMTKGRLKSKQTLSDKAYIYIYIYKRFNNIGRSKGWRTIN